MMMTYSKSGVIKGVVAYALWSLAALGCGCDGCHSDGYKSSWGTELEPPELESALPTIDQYSHFVDCVNGDDSNDGLTLTTAWKTIQHAADTVGAGDVVGIRGGTCPEQVVMQSSGTASAPIVFAAYQDEEPTVDGTDLTLDDGGGLIQLIGTSHLRLSGLKVRNSSHAGILVQGSDNVVIDGNSTDYTGSSGIGVWYSDHVMLDGNELRRAKSRPLPQEWFTINECTNFTVRHNTIDVEYFNAAPVMDIKVSSKHGLVYGNTIRNTAAVSIYVDNWANAEDPSLEDVHVFGNLLVDVGGGVVLSSEGGGLVEKIAIYNNIVVRNTGLIGIGLSDWETNGPRRDILIANNTVVGGGVGVYIHTTNVGNIRILNNLVAFCTIHSGGIRADSFAHIIAQNNLVYDSVEKEYYDPESGTWKPQLEEVPGSLDVDPLLVDAQGFDASDFEVAAHSMAVDAGEAGGSPVFDYWRSLRPADGDGDGEAIVDIGAFERIVP